MERRGRRFRGALFGGPVLFLVVLLAGCSSWRPAGAPVAAVLAEPKAPYHLLVRLRDGSSFAIEEPRIEGDSLLGRRVWERSDPGSRKSREPSGPQVSVALADVAAVERRHTDPLKSAVFLLAVGGFWVLFALYRGLDW